jgi:hypothetical protein
MSLVDRTIKVTGRARMTGPFENARTARSGAPPSSPLRGLSSVKQFTSLDGPHVIRTDGYERNRVPTTINEFDLVSLAVLVDMHDGPHVAASEVLVRRISV